MCKDKRTCDSCYNNEGGLCYCKPTEEDDDMDVEQIPVSNDHPACTGWKPKY